MVSFTGVAVNMSTCFSFTGKHPQSNRKYTHHLSSTSVTMNMLCVFIYPAYQLTNLVNHKKHKYHAPDGTQSTEL